jgi:type II secretory pathway predicted ATPase ExeA
MSPAPWAAHFGLARTPFGKSIPARSLFARQAHAEAIARISFCIVEQSLGVVTGDVGAGKTVALRAAVAGLDPTRHQVIYIANPAFGTRGLYVTIVRALGAQPRYLKAELMAQASDLLAAEAAERHRRVVVICDEAHLLQADQLEELRLLTNSDMDSASPFAAILAGQPTLNRQLRMGIFAALDQRIATRFTIKPMDLAESAAYLKHHLALAPLTELPGRRCRIPGQRASRVTTFRDRDLTGRHAQGSGRPGCPARGRAPRDGGPVGALPAA